MKKGPANSENLGGCPYSKGKAGSMPADSKCPVSGKAAPKTEENSDSEEEKPRGGCPFMGGSDKKKNPNLGLNH